MPDEKQLLTNSRAKAARSCLRLEKIEYRDGYRPLTDAEALRFGTLVHLALEAWWFCFFTLARQYEHLRRKPDGDGLLTALRTLHADEADRNGIEYPPTTAAEQTDALVLALIRIRVEPHFSEADRIRAEEMLRGYDARWKDEPYEPIAIEIQFRAPMINPLTGAKSQTWDVGGKLDLLLQHRETGEKFGGEHKTATADLSPGSTYWKRLRMDSQISTYYDGAVFLGHDIHGFIYDVLLKPGSAPRLATPVEDRKYTVAKYKACPECKKKKPVTPAPHNVLAALEGDPNRIVECEADPDDDKAPRRICSDPGGRLYAGLRDADETPEDYRTRTRATIEAEPGKFYARELIVRLDARLDAFRIDLWDLGRIMREQELAGRFPTNPGACERWGRFCDYFDVCTDQASLDDPTRFKRLDNVHAELDPTTDA